MKNIIEKPHIDTSMKFTDKFTGDICQRFGMCFIEELFPNYYVTLMLDNDMTFLSHYVTGLKVCELSEDLDYMSTADQITCSIHLLKEKIANKNSTLIKKKFESKKALNDPRFIYEKLGISPTSPECMQFIEDKHDFIPAFSLDTPYAGAISYFNDL